MTDNSAGNNMPEADVDLDVALVGRLLAEATTDGNLDPDLSGRPLQLLANGWDNTMFRLGDKHIVRLPRRQQAVDLLRHEQQWLPSLAAQLPLPIPAPVHIGEPSSTFARPWSIVPWFPGQPLGLRNLTTDEASGPAEQLINDITKFLAALHMPAPPDAPVNLHRGTPLADRAERTNLYLAPGSAAMTLVESTDVAKRLRDCWLNALKQPAWPGPSTWIHGDLHPLNLIWNDDRLAAVIDFGDITAGDPACDLAVAWYLFGHEQHGPARRRQFRATAQIGGRAVDDATWSRAMGWALGVAAAIATNSADHPVLNQLAKRTLLAVACSDH